MKVITARIEDKSYKDLIRITQDEKTELAGILRKLLDESIREWKIKKAIQLLKRREVTIRKAASMAEVSYVEMMDLISKERIDIGYSLSDVEKDFG